jgi:cell division protein FtsB
MVEIDFLPEHIKTQRMQRRRTWRCAYLLSVVAVLLVGFTVAIEDSAAETRAEAALLAARRENRKQMRARQVELEAEQAELTINKAISERLGSRVKAVNVLGEIEKVICQADRTKRLVLREWLVETFEVQIPIATPGGRLPAGRTRRDGASVGHPVRRVPRLRVALVGIAADDVTVANFVAQLSANPMFERVNMEYTQTVNFGGRRDARQFKATCYVTR